MSNIISGIFTPADRLQMLSLTQRARREEVIAGNITNSETPGFRALGYDFESQLKEISGRSGDLSLRTSDPRHLKSEFVDADGRISPDVYVRPTESIGEDGNTVDVDKEMAELAQNQIIYRSAIEMINRKIGILRYAINGGR